MSIDISIYNYTYEYTDYTSVYTYIVLHITIHIKGYLVWGGLDIYSDIIIGICSAFYPRGVIFIIFCQAIAEILQHTGSQQSGDGKP